MLHAALTLYLGVTLERQAEYLTRSVMQRAPGPCPPDPEALAALIVKQPSFLTICRTLKRRRMPLPPVLTPPRFAPVEALSAADIPRLLSLDEVAEWLLTDLGQLDWMADVQNRLARPAAVRFRHYRTRWIPKSDGSARLIEAPLPRLKAMQRRVLDEILAQIPTHPAAFGFVPGRNCAMAASRHAGEEMVVTADLSHFFTSVGRARVQGIFRCIGYPTPVARLLAGLCTVVTPSEVLGAGPASTPADLLRKPHLPQGAPTSPALANLAAFRLDRRLSALMEKRGGQYTRYADDLAFSGDRRDFGRDPQTFLSGLKKIVQEEGFTLHSLKTRLMRAGTAQRVTGISVNRHVNPPRAAFDRLKATLINCARHGPASQNRAGHPAFRAHLDGRVMWVESLNPRRGGKLRALYDAIDWGQGA